MKQKYKSEKRKRDSMKKKVRKEAEERPDAATNSLISKVHFSLR